MIPSSVIVSYARLLSVLVLFLVSHIVFGLIFALFVICFILSSVFLFSYFSIVALMFFCAFRYSCRVSSFLLGLFSLVAFWKAAFFIFLFSLATLISSLLGLGSAHFTWAQWWFYNQVSEETFPDHESLSLRLQLCMMDYMRSI